MELSAETARNRVCVDCAHLALCGIAINILRVKRSGVSIDSVGKIDVHGVRIDKEADSICPGELV